MQGRESIERRDDPTVAALSLRRAIELDPGFAQAHAWLSQLHLFIFLVDLRPELLREAFALARKALSLDEADAWSHRAIGYAYMIGGQHELAGIHLDRAVALNPTDTRITWVHAVWLAFAGKGDEAARRLDANLRRDPFPPAWFWNFRGIALFQAGLYREAIEALSRLTKPYPWDYYFLAASYAHLGLFEQARACAAEILRARPGFALGQVGIVEPFQDPADLERLLDGLRKAGLPE